ncbi:hypothetical protein SAY86_031953 [Trapa natans]|uniref:U-box domain-containing protein n=1 Tax=Trapa natans TaxID=22666 RepID=A0AAN7R804_TRANT|nr:hypothetical protein SAY86_031953 [Trapa natans]
MIHTRTLSSASERKMGRDDLYITVPSFFRCPISLDVMTSPVSLCTGVTYDRSSIQRWLDGGNNTCPATMQVLSSTDLVPNLTLQRLIRNWSDSAQPAPLSSPPPLLPDPPLSRDDALALAKSLSSSSCLETSLKRLADFSAESEDNRIFLAKIEGFAEALLHLMSRLDGKLERSVGSLELIVRVFEQVLAKSDNRDKIISLAASQDLRCLSSLQAVVDRGAVESKIASVKILESVAVTEEPKAAIAEIDGFLSRLLELTILETDQNLIESIVSFLIHLAGQKRARIKLLDLGAVKSLSELLAAPRSAVSVTEKALKLVEMISSCREGREALSSYERCIETVLQRAFKVSAVATEHAVTILWGLCCAAEDERTMAVVRRCSGVPRLLVVMQSGCSPAVRRMCGDLLRVFRVSSRSQPCLSNYETKTTHIMPF